MKKTVTTLLSAFLVMTASAHKVEKPQPKVQLAILLDTSSSMSGLIEQTKTQLWKIVNTFSESKKDGQVPFVEVALYEYGNSGLKPGQNFIRQIQPLTRDLDQISEDLFSLTTNGGDEYCGAVIERAIQDLKWDRAGNTYKAIFIAGNEPFTQGPVEPTTACKDAIQHGVIVNTIHCGDHQAGLSGGWQNGALLAEGSFTIINQDQAVAHVAAPQDEAILKLNVELNATYIPYGDLGKKKKLSQIAQDKNAFSKKKSGAAVCRAVTKGSKNYWNGNWDLADACQAKDFDWAKVKDADLPKEMKKLKPEERKAYVQKKIAERKMIQSEIQKLNKARTAYVAQERKKIANKPSTLDEVMTKTVKEQATKKGYQFTKK